MKPIIAAAFVTLLASAAFAQTGPIEAEIAPGLGVPSLGIEPGALPSLALLSPTADPLAYPDPIVVGSVGTPGLVAFDFGGLAEADIATGSLGPAKR